MSASTQLDALQTLLRKQGLGSALRSVAAKRYPPAATGFAELDALLGGGIPRGQITELVGKASSGCTSVVLSLLAEATARQEVAAYIDAADCFDPPSAERAGVKLDRLLWVRCGDEKTGVRAQVSGKTGGTGILGCSLPSRDREGVVQPVDVDIPEEGTACRAPTTEKSPPSLRGSTDQRFNRSTACGSRFTVHERQAWQAVNLVAAAGGFGPIVLDLSGLSQWKLRPWRNRQWMRLLRVMEDSSTALLIISTQHLTSTVSGLVLELSREKTDWAEKQGFSFLLNGITSKGRILHQRRSRWQQEKICRIEIGS